jgi:hypothetical protein
MYTGPLMEHPFHLVKSSVDINTTGSMVMELFVGMKEFSGIEQVQSRLRT